MKQPTVTYNPIVMPPLPKPTPGRAQILTIGFVETFQHGVFIQPHAKITPILGDHAVGKSTLIDAVQYVFNAGELSKKSASRLQKNLRKGHVYAAFATEYGAVYTVTRKWNAPSVVKDAEGKEVAIPIEKLFRVEVLPHNALKTIAEQPNAQMALVDRLAGEDVHAILREEADVITEIRKSATDLAMTVADIADFERAAEQVAPLEERLRPLLEQGGVDAAAVGNAHAEKALRERELHAVSSAKTALQTARNDAGRLAASVQRRNSVIIDEGLLVGANRAHMQVLGKALGEASAAFERAASELAAVCTRVEEVVSREERGLSSSQAKQEAGYSDLMAKTNEEGSRAEARKKLQQDLARAIAAKKSHTLRTADRRALDERHGELVRKLVALRDRRSGLRDDAIHKINQRFGAHLQVELDRGADNTRYRELVEEVLRDNATAERGPRSKDEKAERLVLAPVADKIVDKFTPRELARIVTTNDVESFAKAGGFDVRRAEEYMRWLRARGLIYEIEIVELADSVKMALQQDGEGVPTDELSDGQQSCALLPLVLMQGTHPIFIDQPEDNIHGKFKSTTVVSILREVSALRQVCIATHDPNLAVLPDPKYVVVLGSKKRQGFLQLGGTLDAAKAWIEEYLDGGVEAFRTRQELYGRRP